MATQKYTTHSVGQINSSSPLVVTVPFVKASADIENYTIVELSYNGNGERVASTLADVTHDGYLASAIEVMYDNELLREFYVGNGEYFRVIKLQKGLRFESSSYSGTVAVGSFAHFDPTTKKFVIDGATQSATAKNIFQVVASVPYDWSVGAVSVRFEVVV